MDTQKPSIGRIVHYVDGTVHLAAIVVHVWSDVAVNLQVFASGFNGVVVIPYTVLTVMYSDVLQPESRTWHWPERE